MTATITITRHASERIAQRLEPVLGDVAVEIVKDIVLDAVWNHRFRRTAPKWMGARASVRGDEVRYATGRIDDMRFSIVVALEPGQNPVIVTVITDNTTRPVASLAPVPVMADGRVIGLPRTRALPVAFAQVA